MDSIEKSNNSSFEDLSNLNENELKESAEPAASQSKNDELLDIIGNGQLTKKVRILITIFVYLYCLFIVLLCSFEIYNFQFYLLLV